MSTNPTQPRRRGGGLILLVLLVALAAFGLSKVEFTAPAAFASDNVTCPQATLALTNAQSALAAAQALQLETGTPGEAEKATKVEDAQKALAAAQKAKESCKPVSTGSPTAAPTVTVTATSAGEQFVIKLPPREGGRLNSNGAAKPGDGEAFRAQIAQQAKEDPLTLYLYYMASPLGKVKPLENESVLAKDGRIENGNVFSDVGVQAYKDWLVLWQTADIKAVPEITFQGTNTGVAPSGTTTTQSPGVRGTEKAGVDITYVDASGKASGAHSALYRCLQPTGDNVPGVPEGPTDNELYPKDSSWDPQSRVQVPAPAVKTGRSVDNGSEISGGPVAPVDSGNGVPEGSAPRSTPTASPTHQGGPTLPSPTEPAATLPVPQPTQSASIPPPPPPA